MRKPIVLLVDDDHAVLEALEAALVPRFEEIARFETFDNPADVLAAIPKWTTEKRPILVAVVDQKMPGMTGVELLTRLRDNAGAVGAGQFHPAEHLRGIMLTGYSGLDSALAAKNEARVARYVEKPWDTPKLQRMVSDALAAALEGRDDLVWFEFGEVRRENQIREHLALRHEIYSVSTGLSLIPPEGVRIDLDVFDRFAHFLNLYRVSRDSARIVGTLRIVTETTNAAGAELERIAASHPLLEERLQSEKTERLPLLKYVPDRDAILSLLSRVDREGESIGEPGRLALRAEVRSGSSVTVPLARFMIESSAGHFYSVHSLQHCILACVPVHARFYRPLGFRETEGTRTQFYPRLGWVGTCLHGIASDVPSPARERVAAMTSRVQRSGETCFCSTFPDCLPDAYVSGDFRSADAFCPIVAKRILDGRVEDTQARS